MMQNRVFFPQALLDQWIVDNTIDLSEAELTILAEARRYRLVEAVRVVKEVTETPEATPLIGKVKPRAALLEVGAELMDSSMILGENAYDVVPGWLGTPVTSFEEHLASPERAKAIARQAEFPEEPTSEEELLQRALLKN